jgi:glucose/arabinose dehydrogenase
MTYPSTGHWTRNVVVLPSRDHLFVSIGSGSNVNAEYPPRASVQILQLDGSNQATFVSGVRNPVGMDFHPKTGVPYVAVQERDAFGDDLAPDFFTGFHRDEFYGWPFGN